MFWPRAVLNAVPTAGKGDVSQMAVAGPTLLFSPTFLKSFANF